MNKILYLLLLFFTIYNINAQKMSDYYFDYYSVYEVKQFTVTDSVNHKQIYFANSKNNEYVLKLSLTMNNILTNAEIYDNKYKALIKLNIKEKLVMDDFNLIFKAIENYQIYKYKSLTNSKKIYPKIKQVNVDKYNHIEFSLYDDKKFKKYNNSLFVETEKKDNYKNQFKTLSLMFIHYNNYEAFVNFDTDEIITKIYRPGDVAHSSFEQKLLEIKDIDFSLKF